MRLRCSESFAPLMTHVSVGYSGQYRRSCPSEQTMTVPATASCPTRTIKLSSGGRALRQETVRNQNRGRRLLVCSILLPASCREYPLLGSREEVFRSAEVRPLAAD